MKVVQLKAQNFMKLRAIEITPEGNIVEISGANEQGKSSLLEAMRWAIGGGHAAPDVPIRKGETRAEVMLDLGDLIIERATTEKTPSLKVSAKQVIAGEEVLARLTSPQAVLNRLREHVAFDPGTFMRQKPRDQLDVLRQITGVDTSAIDQQIAQAELERTRLNRAAKETEGAFKSAVHTLPPDCPQEEVDLNELSKELSDGHLLNAANQRKRDELEAERRNTDAADAMVRSRKDAVGEISSRHQREVKELHDRHHAELKSAVDAVNDAEQHCGEKKSMADHLAAEVEELPADADIAKLEGILERAQSDNALARQYQVARSMEAEHTRFSNLAKKAQVLVQAKREERATIVGQAQFPIERLGFGADGVEYKGLPYAQASHAEKLRVSMSIAMALNPDLRVICLEDASTLDSMSRAIVAEMANDHDYQIWEEIVDESGEVGFYIEDGSVKAINGEPTEDAQRQIEIDSGDVEPVPAN